MFFSNIMTMVSSTSSFVHYFFKSEFHNCTLKWDPVLCDYSTLLYIMRETVVIILNHTVLTVFR